MVSQMQVETRYLSYGRTELFVTPSSVSFTNPLYLHLYLGQPNAENQTCRNEIHKPTSGYSLPGLYVVFVRLGLSAYEQFIG
jgi:hypothetical protein